jgi:hypothetical protein
LGVDVGVSGEQPQVLLVNAGKFFVNGINSQLLVAEEELVVLAGLVK